MKSLTWFVVIITRRILLVEYRGETRIKSKQARYSQCMSGYPKQRSENLATEEK
jgi:hypothetical protein